MATGDRADVRARLRTLLPPWFPDVAPVLDGLLAGPAEALAWVHDLVVYAQLQTRIRTATDRWLDLIAADFFGPRIRRRQGQGDASFRARILVELFRERATRAGIAKVVRDLTGRAPIIFEPARPADTGAYGPGPGGDGIGRRLGYGVAGAYGSLLLRDQSFVTAFRPTTSGIPFVAGYGIPVGGYGAPSQISYASLDMIEGAITDADIYAAIDSAAAAGTIVWTRILSSESDLDAAFGLPGPDEGFAYLVDADGLPLFDAAGEYPTVPA